MECGNCKFLINLNIIKNLFKIRPDNINKDSLWTQIDEAEFASDDVFDYLKTKYSTAAKFEKQINLIIK
jgi:hypothetical protein